MTKEQKTNIYSLLFGANIHLGIEGADFVAKNLLKRIKEILENDPKS